MKLFDTARILIYRVHEKGLEVFLVRPDLDEDSNVWKLPSGIGNEYLEGPKGPYIKLETTKVENGEKILTYATEGDYHDIPSIRGIIKHDLKRAKRKIKAYLPDLNKGDFVSAKEACQKLLPVDHQVINELEDIIRQRNLLFHL